MPHTPSTAARRRLRRHLTFANVAAALALVIALGMGTADAAHRITGSAIKDGSLTGRDIRNNSLTGADVKESRLGTVPRAASLVGDVRSGRITLTPYTGAAAATEDTANAAAPKRLLMRFGTLALYGSCFTFHGAADGDRLGGRVTIATTRSGALFTSDDANFGGANAGQVLTTATPLASREVYTSIGIAGDAGYHGPRDTPFVALDGAKSAWVGSYGMYTKFGSIPGVDTYWGSGSSCTFHAWAHAS